MKRPPREIVDRWKYGGESAFDEMDKEMKEQNQRFIDELLKGEAES